METTRIENNRDLDNLYYCINCYYKYKKYNLDINILKKNKDKHANNFFALLSLIGGSFIFSKEIVSYPGLVILDGEVFVIFKDKKSDIYIKNKSTKKKKINSTNIIKEIIYINQPNELQINLLNKFIYIKEKMKLLFYHKIAMLYLLIINIFKVISINFVLFEIENIVDNYISFGTTLMIKYSFIRILLFIFILFISTLISKIIYFKLKEIPLKKIDNSIFLKFIDNIFLLLVLDIYIYRNHANVIVYTFLLFILQIVFLRIVQQKEICSFFNSVLRTIFFMVSLCMTISFYLMLLMMVANNVISLGTNLEYIFNYFILLFLLFRSIHLFKNLHKNLIIIDKNTFEKIFNHYDQEKHKINRECMISLVSNNDMRNVILLKEGNSIILKTNKKVFFECYNEILMKYNIIINNMGEYYSINDTSYQSLKNFITFIDKNIFLNENDGLYLEKNNKINRIDYEKFNIIINKFNRKKYEIQYTILLKILNSIINNHFIIIMDSIFNILSQEEKNLIMEICEEYRMILVVYDVDDCGSKFTHSITLTK